jgi:predicted flap endonuclease-1-like 5' DNA nuclease
MALTQAFPKAFTGAADVEARAEQALSWPIGAVSPLWAVFGAAASAGVAWWWLTRWTRAENVEALAEITAGLTRRSIEIAADSALQVEAAVAAADIAAARSEPPVAEAVAPTAVETAAADDLTRMTGIGPKLSIALAERGVTRFAQIAAWTADDLAEADAALNLKGRAVREAWVAQAKRLAKA